MTTLDSIVRRNAERFPNKAGIVCDGRTVAWRELDDRVSRLANAFAHAGLQAGDRVAVLAGNCAEYFEIYFACARSGVIAVPLNFRLTVDDMVQILSHVTPSLFIVAEDYVDTAADVASKLSPPVTLWAIGAGEARRSSHASYEETVMSSPATLPAHRGNENDTLAVFYTSGTTGLPKGAMVSHLNLEMNGYNQIIADQSRADDINLVATPIYHMGAVFMAITYMLLGCTQVILPRFEPKAWLTTLENSHATVSLLIPTMINAVLNEPTVASHDLHRLRLIFYGGGPMPPAVLKRAMETFGCGFTQGYGLTETLEASFLVAEDHRLDADETTTRRLASAGREAIGADIRIVDDTGTEVPTNEVGEILIRSRSVISGYWDNPEETERTIRDGWFYTGDLGYLDEERYLFLVDRKKDMVVSGGVNIYTKEIEAVLYQHPDVLEAAVIGLPDEEWGEIVTAVIAPKPDRSLAVDTITAHCADRLAGFKKPKRVEFLTELPKNPSGKILKRDLRDKFT